MTEHKQKMQKGQESVSGEYLGAKMRARSLHSVRSHANGKRQFWNGLGFFNDSTEVMAGVSLRVTFRVCNDSGHYLNLAVTMISSQQTQTSSDAWTQL